VHRSGLAPHIAWRVSFIVPFILITAVAIAMLLLCEDTPTGKWSDREKALPVEQHHTAIVSTAGNLTDKATTSSISSGDDKEKIQNRADVEANTAVGQSVDAIEAAHGEVVVAPSGKEALKVLCSLQTITLCASYVCSFGGELAINSILGSYYLKNFAYLGQTTSGRWAAMFGLLNIITRPAGGFFGDLIFRWSGHNLWAKKFWIHFVGVMSGIFLIVIGKLDPKELDTMIGLIALMAIFLEAGNGANFALVPHVHPHANVRASRPPCIKHSTDCIIGHCLRYRRRERESRWYHLRHYFPLQRHALCARVLDHGVYHYWVERCLLVGPADFQGAALARCRLVISHAPFPLRAKKIPRFNTFIRLCVHEL
jgi:NNP family nitrate/nitrite transporter-like MFS transporter